MLLDVVEDAGLKLLDAGEDAAPELVFGQVAEEALDHVEPAAGGRREVEVEARMPCGPLQHVGMLVSGVVVDDEMKLLLLRGLAVDQTQELEPLLMAVALHAGGHHRAVVERVQRGKQRYHPSIALQQKFESRGGEIKLRKIDRWVTVPMRSPSSPLTPTGRSLLIQNLVREAKVHLAGPVAPHLAA